MSRHLQVVFVLSAIAATTMFPSGVFAIGVTGLAEDHVLVGGQAPPTIAANAGLSGRGVVNVHGLKTDGKQFQGSGLLIENGFGQQWILTAGHVVDAFEPNPGTGDTRGSNDVSIFLFDYVTPGGLVKNKSGVENSVLFHPDYKEWASGFIDPITGKPSFMAPAGYDIALVLVKDNSKMPNAPQYELFSGNAEGKQAVIMGFGSPWQGNNGNPNTPVDQEPTLRYATNRIDPGAQFQLNDQINGVPVHTSRESTQISFDFDDGTELRDATSRLSTLPAADEGGINGPLPVDTSRTSWGGMITEGGRFSR